MPLYEDFSPENSDSFRPMPPPYNNQHWATFAGIPYVAAGSVGYIPSAWVASHALQGVPLGAIPLPAGQLNRATVRAICRNSANPVLFGYVCAMAWGLQGSGKGARTHVAQAWAARTILTPKLNALRAGGLSRAQSYQLFMGINAVPGLGPAYFTKLLYFFRPQTDAYIMDQHTGKSINLITGTKLVRMVANAVSRGNKHGNYQAYCEEMDAIAGLVGVTGEQAEEMMMSKGGHSPSPWRAHMRTNWPLHAPAGRYSRKVMHAIYPHIPLGNL
jgi:hypothetical protein